MKNKYPIQVIDLRFQVDHITPEKTQLYEEFNTDPANVDARLFVILIRHKHFEMISDGSETIEVEVIKMKILNFKDFKKKYNSSKNTMNERELQRVYNYPI